jgi:hypothetical protein
MAGVATLLAAALATAPLPPLPLRGLARETQPGVELQTMRGHPLATLRGLDLASDKVTSQGLIMRDRRGRLFVLDPEARRVRGVSERAAIAAGCRLTDARRHVQLLVCGRTIKTLANDGRVRVAARAPVRSPAGHWERAMFAPRGDVFLAQWIAECEVPVAYLVSPGKLRRYDGESVALGWLSQGVAVIHFPNGPCGGSSRPRGIYAVPRSGKPRLILRTPRLAQYLMWGG